MNPIHLGVGVKLAVFESILAQYQLDSTEVACIGDDYPDMDLIQSCGWGVAVADAAPGLKRHADWVCTRPGGQGAVAEMLERILRQQGHWQITIDAHG